MEPEKYRLCDTLSYLYASAHKQKVEAERNIERIYQAAARHGITRDELQNAHFQRARMDSAPREVETGKPLFAIPTIPKV